MVFIFPISCILVLIFPFFMIYFLKCAGKGSFPKSQIKSLISESPFQKSWICPLINEYLLREGQKLSWSLELDSVGSSTSKPGSRNKISCYWNTVILKLSTFFGQENSVIFCLKQHFEMLVPNWDMNRPTVIIFFSGSSWLSMKFWLHIETKILKNKDFSLLCTYMVYLSC